MSAEFQVFFRQSPTAIALQRREPMVSVAEMEAAVEEASRSAVEKLRQGYEAQLNELRSEAIEFHQHFINAMEDAMERWKADWEREIPALVFAGVRAVLKDFELSDEQLQQWVNGALVEYGFSEKSRIELHISPRNHERLRAFWERAGLAAPPFCQICPDPSLSDGQCIVSGMGGILDASLPNRLSQLQRLWKLAQ